MSSVICHLSSFVCHLLSFVCHLLTVIYYQPFVIFRKEMKKNADELEESLIDFGVRIIKHR
ncbi:MAG: hypothetical protein ABI557_03270 [Aureliella sp.]